MEENIKILEDRGYGLSEGEKFTSKEVELTLKALAEIHALNLIFEDKKNILNRKNLLREQGLSIKSTLNSLFELSFEETEYLEELKLKADKFLIKCNKELKFVLDCGNLRRKHIYFKQDCCKIVNTSTTIKPPLQDVLNFLQNCAQNKEDIPKYVSIYYKFLGDEFKNHNAEVEDYLPIYQATAKLVCSEIRFLQLLDKITTITKGSSSLESVVKLEQLLHTAKELKEILEVEHISAQDRFRVVCNKLKSDNFEILDYSERAFDSNDGFLGDYSILEISVLFNNKRENFSFFAKGLPKDEVKRTYVEEFCGFFKECQFFTKYRDLLKRHKINVLEGAVPECYLTTEEVLIFDNLKIGGFFSPSPRDPVSKELVETGLKSFAQLHASGLILEEKKNFKLTEEFETELQESFYAENQSSYDSMNAFKRGIEALIDLSDGEIYQRMTKEKFKELAADGVDKQRIFTRPSKQFRNTICHGDPWSKNLMFQSAASGEVLRSVIVDFQTYRYGPPAQDVMCYLHLIAEKSLRDLYMEDFLRFYYEELNNNLEKFGCKDLIRFEEFDESCRYFKQFSLTQTITHFMLLFLSEEHTDKYEFIQRVCREDDLFRTRSLEGIGELREFYEDNSIN